MRTFLRLAPIAAFALLAPSACGGDDGDKPAICTEGTSTGCEADQICEPVPNGDPICAAPIEVRGRVFDALTDDPIAGALVVAIDANGGARSTVAESAADGTYRLQLLAERDAQGNPRNVSEAFTLRAAAAGYERFPKPPRQALPSELGTATAVDNGKVLAIESSATDIALLPLPGGGQGLGTITGRVVAEDPGGVLVLAVQGDASVSSGITDSAGDFALFNVPPGATEVKGYRGGLNIQPEAVTATDGTVSDVELQASTSGLTRLEGSVNFVNAGAQLTSVILVPEETFDPLAARGEAPAGLRAGDVTGTFAVDGIPPGEYAVLAAFENDLLVRDPDTSISGTDVVFVTLDGVEPTVVLSQAFKITGALAVHQPGADGLEVVDTTSPTFVWEQDSSEDGYELRVFDAFGELLLEETDLPEGSGSDPIEYTWSNAPLVEGMIYQFRAKSFRDTKDGRVYISMTEDLLGVFVYQAQ